MSKNVIGMERKDRSSIFKEILYNYDFNKILNNYDEISLLNKFNGV